LIEPYGARAGELNTRSIDMIAGRHVYPRLLPGGFHLHT
jgi:hypothetical protein